MPDSDCESRLNQADFAGAMDAWRVAFTGREDSLEASWDLAEVEERWGDWLFFGAEGGAAAHYRASQRALVPQGAVFTSSEESERRMEAFGRLTNKLYAVGPDGKARPVHDAKPHPRFHLTVARPVADPEPPKKSKAERLEKVQEVQQARTARDTGLGKLHSDDDHGCHYQLGRLWFEAAKALAPGYPNEVHDACKWSIYHFELYNIAWTAHLPASRWDSDGGLEMMDVQELENSLGMASAESPLPDWISVLIEGDWQAALAKLGDQTPAPEFQPFVKLLVHACHYAGRPDAVRDLLPKLPE